MKLILITIAILCFGLIALQIQKPKGFLPTNSHGNTPAAIISGTLEERNDCVYLTIDHDRSGLVIWPQGYTFDSKRGKIFNRLGFPVAEIGKEVRMGGGGANLQDRLEKIDETNPFSFLSDEDLGLLKEMNCLDSISGFALVSGIVNE